MSFTIDPLIGGMQQVLDLRLQQHALTASNLANSDTPGFRAKMIDFSHVLEEAVTGQSLLRRTDARHLDVGGADAANPPVEELEPAPWSLDGNSVNPERETARLQANSLMYQALVQGIDRKLALLSFAASDGR